MEKEAGGVKSSWSSWGVRNSFDPWKLEAKYLVRAYDDTALHDIAGNTQR